MQDITKEEIERMMSGMMAEDPSMKQEFDFLATITPYLGKSEEELQKEIPEGIYSVGGSKLVAYTGKQGFINIILAYSKIKYETGE